MKTYLEQIAPGARFRTMSGKEGVLVYCGVGSARVQWGSGGVKTVTFTRPGIDPKTGAAFAPESKTFNTPAAEENIAPRTEVTEVAA